MWHSGKGKLIRPFKAESRPELNQFFSLSFAFPTELKMLFVGLQPAISRGTEHGIA